MRRVKGSFVCGESDQANDRHQREEVTLVINKLNPKLSSAFVTVLDKIYIGVLCTNDKHDAVEDT